MAQENEREALFWGRVPKKVFNWVELLRESAFLGNRKLKFKGRK